MNKSKRVSKMIRGKRLELGISQHQVAKRIGMKQGQFISNIERDLCALPIKYVQRIGKVLDINADHLVVAIKEDYSDYVDEEISTQIKNFWGNWEEEEIIKPKPSTFVQDLRNRMDAENLNNFLRV